jgi:hypothetical protein
VGVDAGPVVFPAVDDLPDPWGPAVGRGFPCSAAVPGPEGPRGPRTWLPFVNAAKPNTVMAISPHPTTNSLSASPVLNVRPHRGHRRGAIRKVVCGRHPKGAPRHRAPSADTCVFPLASSRCSTRTSMASPRGHDPANVQSLHQQTSAVEWCKLHPVYCAPTGQRFQLSPIPDAPYRPAAAEMCGIALGH